MKHEVGTYVKDYFQETIQPLGSFGNRGSTCSSSRRTRRDARGDEVVVTADMRVASGRPSRIPDGLRAILSPPDLASGTGQGAPLIL